jgi:hypothetical protein
MGAGMGPDGIIRPGLVLAAFRVSSSFSPLAANRAIEMRMNPRPAFH